MNEDFKQNEEKKELEKTLKRIERANEILKKYPESSWQEIYRTLLLLEKSPIERLGHALLRRGRVQITP